MNKIYLKNAFYIENASSNAEHLNSTTNPSHHIKVLCYKCKNSRDHLVSQFYDSTTKFLPFSNLSTNEMTAIGTASMYLDWVKDQ